MRVELINSAYRVNPISPTCPISDKKEDSEKYDSNQNNSKKDSQEQLPLGEWQEDSQGRFILA